MDRTGATPKKLALVAVLAMVLAGVIWHQVFGAHQEEVAAKPQRPAASTPNLKDTSKKSPPKVDEQSPSASDHIVTAPEWQEMPLRDVLAHDPFQPPQWFVLANQPIAERESSATAENTEKLLEQLKQKSMNIVVISGTTKIATIGGNEVRVGDLIEGFRVTDITTEGITLSEMKLQ